MGKEVREKHRTFCCDAARFRPRRPRNFHARKF